MKNVWKNVAYAPGKILTKLPVYIIYIYIYTVPLFVGSEISVY